MALPESAADFKWPPEEWDDVFALYNEHSAWFSGDPAELALVYGGAPSRKDPAGFWRTNFDRFWSRQMTAPARRLMLHVPIGGDLATKNADLLFSEAPALVVPGSAEGDEKATAVQKRLDKVTELENFVRTFTEAGETASALGGVFMKTNWDLEVQDDRPILSVVDADAAVPEFRWGRLQAVTFWQTLEETGKEVVRHLERHERGVILNGVYRGTPQYLGLREPFTSWPELGLSAEEAEIQTGIDKLTAVYVPNVRPNRQFRKATGPNLRWLGRSDYAGAEAFMDALDEAWTSLMRDLRLARARLIVPQDYLISLGQSSGAAFDIDQEVWEALPMPVAKDGTNMITPNQFAIRTAEHLALITGLVQRIIAAAGYSAATFGLESAGTVVPQTATEIINRERQSFVTRAKKITYWQEPMADILEAYLALDAAHFKEHPVIRPRVVFADSIHDDPKEQASVAQILRAAESASAEIRVRMLHPKWTDAQVYAERDRLLKEFGKQAPAAPTAVSSSNGTAPGGMMPSEMDTPAGMPADQQQRGAEDQVREGNFAPSVKNA